MGWEASVIRCQVVVKGRVQGVGFRWFVRERARSLGLSGCVGNRSDGAVEIEVEGGRIAVESLITDLRVGPPGARVDGVETFVLKAAPEGLPNPFAIER